MRLIKNRGNLPEKYTHSDALILAQAKMSVKQMDLGGEKPKKLL
jgi:hypothetical protein